MSTPQMQVLRLRLPLDHPCDEDLSLGTPSNAANSAQDDRAFLSRTLGTVAEAASIPGATWLAEPSLRCGLQPIFFLDREGWSSIPACTLVRP